MLVRIENATKAIKGATILNNISIGFEEGKIYGLRGKNGSGKTMLLRLIAGLILPTSGSVYIGEEKLGKDISFPPSIGVLIENPSFISNYTGFENLKSLASIQRRINDDEIKDSIRSVGLDPQDRRPFRKYSLGMKQRLGIACAVMEKPDIVLLDEPYSALDDNAIALTSEIIQKQRQRGGLVILASHEWDTIRDIVDRTVDMENGKIVGSQFQCSVSSNQETPV